MTRFGFFLRDKSLRKKFPDKINTWNASVIESLSTFAVAVSSLFLLYCIFNKTKTSLIIFALVAFGIFITYKITSVKFLKFHIDKSTKALFIFWGLFTVYIAFMNEFVYQSIPGYLFGIVLIFLGLIIQASFSSVFILSSLSTCVYLLFVYLNSSQSDPILDIIVALTAYALTLLGSNIITGTRTVELADLTELQKLSSLDPLTRLLNRRSAQFLIENKLSNKDKGYFVVVDIDNFKGVNDNNGHLEGDKYLQGLASVLKKSASSDSVVSRIGGDEFIVFLPNYKQKEAGVFAHKVQKLMQSNVANLDDGMGTVSMGLSCVKRSDTYSSLFERADLALYNIKLNGKNNFAFFKEKDNSFELYPDAPVMLIVDDTFIIRKLLQNYFEDEFVVLQAENGEQAMKMLMRNSNVSIILLDMKMPIMNGSEFLNEYKKHESISHIPVVVITADPTLEGEALAQGAVDMIVKPFDANIVKLRVHNAVNYSK